MITLSGRLGHLDAPYVALIAALTGTAGIVGALSGANPILALAASLAVGYVAIALTNLTVGLIAFVFLSFLEVLPVGSGASAIRVAGLLLAVSWLAVFVTNGSAARARDYLRAHSTHVALIGLFLGWAALSITWTNLPGQSENTLPRYALNMALFPIVFTAIRRPQHVEWLLWAFLLGAAASVIVGLTGEQQVEVEGRLSGAGVNPVDLAAQLVAAAVLALALAGVNRRTSVRRLAAYGLAVFCIVGLLLTVSRGGLLALGVAMLLGLLVANRRRGRSLAMVLVAILALVAYFGLLAPPEARERVTTVGSGTGRTDIWAVGWRMVEDRPIAGVGTGNFRATSGRYAVQPGAPVSSGEEAPRLAARGEELVAHNAYLETLAELGIVGLLGYLLVIAVPMAATLRAARGFMRQAHARMERIARAVFVAQAGMLAAAFFASIQFNKQLWLLLALGPAMLAIAEELRQQGARES